MLDSASGVSITRSGPKRACSPSVALKTPPLRPTSSPRTHTRGSRSISSARASRTAWTRVRSAIRVDVARQGAGVGIGGSLGQGGRGIYLLLERGADPPVLGLAEPAQLLQLVLEDRDRIVLGLGGQLPGIAVGALVVISRVGLEAQDLGLDQARAVAGPGASRRLRHRPIDGEEVVTRHRHPRDAVGRRSRGDAGSGHLERLGNRDRPVVVLAEEDHRAAMDRGEVEALVEITLAGRALPEAHVAERALPLPFQAQSDAGGFGDLGTDRARADDHPAPPAPEVARRLA